MTSGSVSRTAALKTLGLSDPCSKAEMSAAYRRLARSMHPDMSGVPNRDVVDRFTSLTDAYRLLTTPSSPAPPTPPTTRTPTTPAPRLRLADPPFVEVRPEQSPIVAGPVRIRPLPRNPRGSA